MYGYFLFWYKYGAAEEFKANGRAFDAPSKNVQNNVYQEICNEEQPHPAHRRA